MTRMLVIAGSTAALLLLQYVGQMMRISVASLTSAIIIVGGIVLNRRHGSSLLPTANSDRERTLRRTLLALIGFAAYKTLFDAIDTYQLDPLVGLITLIRDLTQFGIAALVMGSFRQDELAEALSAFGVGVAVYAGANLIAFQMGVVPQQLVTQAFAAVSSGLQERIVAPFGPGLNSFGSMVACGFLFCLFGAREFLLKKQPTRALAPLAGSLVCLYAIYRVEMRAGLISVLFGLGWLCLGNVVAKRIVVIATVVGTVLFPLFAATSAFISLLELAIPQFILDNFQRTTQDFSTLGGRVDMWRYGFDLIVAGKTGWLGQGLTLRDASPVVDSATVDVFGSVTLSFHNGFVELLVVYGPLLGLFGSLALVYASWVAGGGWSSVAQRGQGVPTKKTPVDSIIGLSCCLLISTLFEAFTATAFFWSVVLLIYSAFVVAVARPPVGETTGVIRGAVPAGR